MTSQASSAPPALAEDEIHIWTIDLRPQSGLSSAENDLSEDEIRRANAFHFPRDRKRFVRCRSSVRTILGHYVSMDPSRVQFDYGPRGKPALTGQAPNQQVCFNVSHSGDLAVIALTLNRSIGVDVEELRTDSDLESIAEKFFSPRERAALEALSPSARDRAFFLCWTRKEAYVKASGDGLARALDQFDVSLNADGPIELVTRPDLAEAARWSLYNLTLDAHYAAAVAVQGSQLRLKVCNDTQESVRSNVTL